MKARIYLLLNIMILTAIACGSSQMIISQFPTPSSNKDASRHTPTLVVETAEIQVVTVTSVPSKTVPIPTKKLFGSISGYLYYGSSHIPEGYLVVFDIDTDEIFYIETGFNQHEFQIDNLPPGKYYVTFYLPDNPDQEDKWKFLYAHTEYYECIHNSAPPHDECENLHSPIAVEVFPGEITKDIHVFDILGIIETGFPINPIKP